MRYLLLLAIAPGAFIVYKVYKQDTIEKEPAGLIKKLLIAGALSVIPALILEIIASCISDAICGESGSIIRIAVDAFIATALVEEGCKLFFLKKITWNNPEFNYTFDAIVYAVSVSMGFAILENIAYVLSNGFGNAIMRALTAIPGHAVFAVYMGYNYGLAKLCDAYGSKRGVKRYKKMALLTSVLLHGFYDYCLMRGTGLSVLVFFIFVIILFIITYKNLGKYSFEDRKI